MTLRERVRMAIATNPGKLSFRYSRLPQCMRISGTRRVPRGSVISMVSPQIQNELSSSTGCFELCCQCQYVNDFISRHHLTCAMKAMLLTQDISKTLFNAPRLYLRLILPGNPVCQEFLLLSTPRRLLYFCRRSCTSLHN